MISSVFCFFLFLINSSSYNTITHPSHTKKKSDILQLDAKSQDSHPDYYSKIQKMKSLDAMGKTVQEMMHENFTAVGKEKHTRSASENATGVLEEKNVVEHSYPLSDSEMESPGLCVFFTCTCGFVDASCTHTYMLTLQNEIGEQS